MTNQRTRISRGLAAAIDSVLSGSHQSLDRLFLSAGAPGPVPSGSHAHKWKDWITSAGRDPSVDNFAFLGALIEEFIDVPPIGDSEQEIPFGVEPTEEKTQRIYKENRKRVQEALAADGLQYFRGGRIVPNGVGGITNHVIAQNPTSDKTLAVLPSSIDEVLIRILRGLRRAMYPLTHRRKGLPAINFESEYDVQDLLHALLRPWVRDIRPEEFTPSYAGKSTRMDFLLPDHGTVIELKFVRDIAHGRNIGQELQIDIGHYRQHPKCNRLWCAVFDPAGYLVNCDGLERDLEGLHRQGDFSVEVKLLLL